MDYSPKMLRRIARARNPDLRDYYEYLISEIPSYCRLYVDETGCDKTVGHRRGWAPRGVTPEKIVQFPRGQRYQILPALDQDGIVFYRIFQGSTDATLFLEFMEQLLPHCNPFFGGRFGGPFLDPYSIIHLGHTRTKKPVLGPFSGESVLYPSSSL